ncbi:hypothetical protein JCM10212_004697 [Sporobolomyces blumeae]
MSLLRRALRSVGLRVGKDRYLAGTDLEGNSFYERPHPEYPDEWRKNKRTVEYRVTKHLSDYNYETIPVQWSSWLRRTRRDPPTLPELERDYHRQVRLQSNVEKLRLAYHDEKLRLAESNREALALNSPNWPTAEPAQAATTEGGGRGGGARLVEPSPQETRDQFSGQGDVLGQKGQFEAGMPKPDVGIGAREAQIGKHLGGIDDQAPPPGSGLGASEHERFGGERESVQVKPEDADEVARQRREEEREAARKRREEFARSAPPTGNPSDSFEPEAWFPAGPARRRRG